MGDVTPYVEPYIKHDYLTDEELAALGAKMRVADPNKLDESAFTSTDRASALTYLDIMGVKGLKASATSRIPDDEITQKLRHAFWDVQRIDNIFPGEKFSSPAKGQGLDIEGLPSWKDWEKPHHELDNHKMGQVRVDGFKDAARMNSYVSTHFSISAFTQSEIQANVPINHPKDISGAWIATKATMGKAALDITRSGGADTPFVCYHTPNETMLVMEILDVKMCAWPEPSVKFRQQLGTCQETKFGHAATDPLVPMMQTPKMPLITVRYSYIDGRPEGGSKFVGYLESRQKKKKPVGRAARENVLFHLGASIAVESSHLLMFSRLLSYNAGLVDPEYVMRLQSHWNHASREVVQETRISFFVPCLRLRWRALEEIETGIPVKIKGQPCNTCGKAPAKMLCTSCKSASYCSVSCNTNHWSTHKPICKTSARLLKDPNTFPANKLYIPARSYVDFVPESGFTIEQESVKFSGSTNIGDAMRNEYGDERFIVRTLMPPGYSHGGGRFRGQTVFLWDRRRSVLLRSGPGDPIMAKDMGHTLAIPFHPAGYARYIKVIREKGTNRGQLIYLWARRVGDTLELDLEDVPKQPFWE